MMHRMAICLFAVQNSIDYTLRRRILTSSPVTLYILSLLRLPLPLIVMG